MMTPHGPDTECYAKASEGELKPIRVADGTQVSHKDKYSFYNSLVVHV